jgi:1-acyl-sn-glycerol-3-phosphate acyltransferase
VAERLNYLWRLAATAFAYTAFAAGGIVLAYAVIPIVSLATPRGLRREQRIQYLVHLAFRLFVLCMRGLGLMALRVDGESVLTSCRGKLIVANHPTLIDVVVLVSLNPRVHCMVKPGLWRNPFLKGVVASAGYINSELPINELIAAAARALGSGSNLLIFPEGTRTQPGAPLRFQRGFANIAIKAAAPIQTAIISCTPAMLTKNLPWYAIPVERPVMHVTAGACLDVSDTLRHMTRPLAARRIVGDLETYFSSVLSDGGSGDGTESPDCRRLESGGYLA